MVRRQQILRRRKWKVYRAVNRHLSLQAGRTEQTPELPQHPSQHTCLQSHMVSLPDLAFPMFRQRVATEIPP